MRIRRHAAAAALALSAAATAGPLAPSPAFGFEETGSIQGTVVAEDGGAPLPAALVVLDGTALSATTGADGRFAIDGVAAGAYRLTVTREAFAELALPVTVAAGQPVLLDLRLAVLQFEESVVVTATQTERAVTEVAASVTILDAETIEASSARNLQDLLRRTPGFDLAETSGMAARANSSLVMRGVPGTKRALLLVDGLPANDLGPRQPGRAEPGAARNRSSARRWSADRSRASTAPTPSPAPSTPSRGPAQARPPRTSSPAAARPATTSSGRRCAGSPVPSPIPSRRNRRKGSTTSTTATPAPCPPSPATAACSRGRSRCATSATRTCG